MHTFGDVVVVNTRRLKKNLKENFQNTDINLVNELIASVSRKYVVVQPSNWYGYTCVDLAGNKRHLPHQCLKRIRKANPIHVEKLKKALEA